MWMCNFFVPKTWEIIWKANGRHFRLWRFIVPKGRQQQPQKTPTLRIANFLIQFIVFLFVPKKKPWEIVSIIVSNILEIKGKIILKYGHFLFLKWGKIVPKTVPQACHGSLINFQTSYIWVTKKVGIAQKNRKEIKKNCTKLYHIIILSKRVLIFNFDKKKVQNSNKNSDELSMYILFVSKTWKQFRT